MTPLLDAPARPTDVDGPIAPGTDDVGPGGPGPAVVPPSPVARLAALVAVGAALLAVVVAALGATVLSGDGNGQVIDGTLEATHTGTGEVSSLGAGDALPEAATLRATEGAASIRIGDTELTVDAGAVLIVADGDGYTLDRGSIRISSSSASAFTLGVGATEATGRGVWRADVGPASRIATYRGRVEARDGGRAVELERFEQVDVRGGALDGTIVPLRYLDSDPWDREELADAIATDRLAEQLTTAMTAAHGADLRSPDFYASFAGADDEVLARLGDLAPRRQAERAGPPAAVLLGIAVADALVEDAGVAPAPALARVVELRRGGATWGLILLTHDLGPSSLRAAADRALDRAAADPPPDDPPASAGGDTAPGAGDTPGVGSAPATGAGTGTGGPAPSSPSPPPGPSPSPSPSPAPSPSPSPSPEGGLLGPVEDLVRGTGGAVGGLVEGTADTVGDVIGTVDDLLPGIGGLLGGG